MSGLGELIDEIAEVLWANVSAPQLPAICSRFGLADGEESEAYSSKRAYVRKRITAWPKEKLVDLALRVQDTYPSDALQCQVEHFAPEMFLCISEITRQHVLRDLASLGAIEGKLDLLAFLGKLWRLDTMSASGTDLRCLTLQDDIIQHMIRNDDYSYGDLFDLLDVQEMSNKKFAEFLEWIVHPLVRVDADQEQYVSSINSHLRHDGLALVAADDVSGFPLFRVTQIVDGVSGSAKNLIFASTGPKPEIVFSDAVNNDIQVVKNAEFCLIYDHPFSKDGLLWKHLIAWWAATTGSAIDDIETERKLYGRLYQSLQSPPERTLFRTYFERFRSKLGERLPALIPQVYLHYDPYTARTLRGKRRVPRQRMDFLLLLSPLQRIVIEVDGSQHYSEDGLASPLKYAEMVSADRDLRLAGYEVYRFGGPEVIDNAGVSRVESFFARLFEKHGIRGLEAQTSQGETADT